MNERTPDERLAWFELMDKCEFLSVLFEGAVYIRRGAVIQNSICLTANPSKETQNTLIDEFILSELGSQS